MYSQERVDNIFEMILEKEAGIVRVVESQLGGYVDVSEGGCHPKLHHV